MANDVAAMISEVMDEGHWPGEAVAIRRHLRDALKHYRNRRFYFSEKSATRTTVAGVYELARSAGPNGYPADLLELDSLRVVSGSGEVIVRKTGFHNIRELQANSTSSRETPSVYAFYADKLLLYPTPGSAWTLKFDYVFDATLDTATGTAIDGSNGALTNAYFDRGAELLRSAIIMRMSLGRTEDGQLAISAKAINEAAERSLTNESTLRKVGSSFSVRPSF
jgi:hypothetical protein